MTTGLCLVKATQKKKKDLIKQAGLKLGRNAGHSLNLHTLLLGIVFPNGMNILKLKKYIAMIHSKSWINKLHDLNILIYEMQFNLNLWMDTLTSPIFVLLTKNLLLVILCKHGNFSLFLDTLHCLQPKPSPSCHTKFC